MDVLNKVTDFIDDNIRVFRVFICIFPHPYFKSNVSSLEVALFNSSSP